LQERAKQNVR